MDGVKGPRLGPQLRAGLRAEPGHRGGALGTRPVALALGVGPETRAEPGKKIGGTPSPTLCAGWPRPQLRSPKHSFMPPREARNDLGTSGLDKEPEPFQQ